ncbi:MAG: gamma-glutamylcyclotransferase [Rhodobacteraceae bacterium]|nr:gamma-glutamylcyclotransferase [Paracoccaceae bacterium]TVR50171.1 MAG: gamma-glutamylcyclotransferase [Paracoccaceae bacterium]
MSDPFFFGYGSLVNRDTHDYPDAVPATSLGWRREWRVAHRFGRTFLSAVRDPGAAIDGLVARVPGDDWAALDLREAGYARHILPADDLRTPQPVTAQIYAIAEAHSALPTPAHPIKLSYLDVVVAGFLREFGETGVARFFETTTGWTSPFDDRAAPLYARARPVSAQTRDLVDTHLAARGVTILRD